MKTNIHFLSYHSQLLSEWKTFQTKAVEKIKTHFMFNIFFFPENRTVHDNVEIYCRARQATDDNTAHAHCMLDTQVYKHTQNM